MTKWHGGKGSGRRKGADDKKFADNWDAIFGKKNDTDLKFTTAEDFMSSVSEEENDENLECPQSETSTHRAK